jgi:Arc/MetJ-type ribon-helix-helix transcriptional regulator
MKRTTITLPDDLAMAVEREAHRRRASLSEVVREALASYLGFTGRPRRLPFAGLGESGQQSTARDFESVLESEWASDRDR